jgi:hypothetical protein
MNASCCRASHAASTTVKNCISDDACAMLRAYLTAHHHAPLTSIEYLDITGSTVTGRIASQASQ